MRRRDCLMLAALSACGPAFADNITDLGDAINKAGRQRMLSQRMAKSYLAQAMGVEAELANRSLQEDTISQPTAGFLYFRNSNSKKKDAAYELQYAPNSDSAPVTPVKLVIPKL